MNATVRIEVVEPKKAAHYLARLLEGQRNLREGHILRLATELEENHWHLSSDALMFVKGHLANGQHRLQAVVLADKAAQFLVLETDDEEVYKILDSGIGRSTGDALTHLGIGCGKEIAAVVTLVMRYDRGAITSYGRNFDKSNKITRTHLIDYIEEHEKQLTKEVTECIALCASKRILPVSLSGALLHLANRGGKGDGWSFIRNLYLGGSQDAAHDLRERLIRNNSSKMKLAREYVFGLLIKGYRSYVNGTRPGVLKIIEGEEFPKMP